MFAPLAGSCLHSYFFVCVLILLHDWESYYYSNSSNNNNNNPSGNSEIYVWKVKTRRLFCFTCIFGCLFLWLICFFRKCISLPVGKEQTKPFIIIPHLRGHVRSFYREVGRKQGASVPSLRSSQGSLWFYGNCLPIWSSSTFWLSWACELISSAVDSRATRRDNPKALNLSEPFIES